MDTYISDEQQPGKKSSPPPSPIAVTPPVFRAPPTTTAVLPNTTTVAVRELSEKTGFIITQIDGFLDSVPEGRVLYQFILGLNWSPVQLDAFLRSLSDSELLDGRESTRAWGLKEIVNNISAPPNKTGSDEDEYDNHYNNYIFELADYLTRSGRANDFLTALKDDLSGETRKPEYKPATDEEIMQTLQKLLGNANPNLQELTHLLYILNWPNSELDSFLQNSENELLRQLTDSIPNPARTSPANYRDELAQKLRSRGLFSDFLTALQAKLKKQSITTPLLLQKKCRENLA